MLKLGPMKLMGDGSLSGRTAAVSVPYEDTNDVGIIYRDQEELDRIICELNRRGFQISVHAIGDRAVEHILHAYEKVIGRCKPNTKRHRIEHAGILNPRLIQSFADMVILSRDPLTTPPDTWEDQIHVEMTIVGGEIVYDAQS